MPIETICLPGVLILHSYCTHIHTYVTFVPQQCYFYTPCQIPKEQICFALPNYAPFKPVISVGTVSVYAMDQYVLRFNTLRKLQKLLHSANASPETCNWNCRRVSWQSDWGGKAPLAFTPNLLLRADSVKRGATLAFFHFSGIFSHHHDYSKIKNPSSSLSTCGCIPSASMDLFKISLTRSFFTEGKHELFQIFQLASEARDLWMSALSVKTEAKQELSTSTFLHGFGCHVPHPIQQQSNISLAFLLLMMHA